jgi:hypothetical protein
MNNKLLFMSKSPIEGFNLGYLEVDMDENAEVIFVIDRTSGENMAYELRPSSGVYKAVFDVKYGIDANLLVGIIDLGGEYNAAIKDRVLLQIVDGNTVNLKG